MPSRRHELPLGVVERVGDGALGDDCPVGVPRTGWREDASRAGIVALTTDVGKDAMSEDRSGDTQPAQAPEDEQFEPPAIVTIGKLAAVTFGSPGPPFEGATSYL